MTATKPRTADRLTFAWQPSFRPEYRLDVTVTECRPRAGDVSIRYMLDEFETLPNGRVFLVAKDDDDSPDVYETFVGNDGQTFCSCPGSTCRRHGIVCRHAQACIHVITEGAI
jgi:hypothetical protein